MPGARPQFDAGLATLAGVAALALLALLGAALASGAAVAGDAIAVYEPEPASDAAEPGETVTVEVYVSSDGGYAGEGLERYDFVVAVDPDVAEIASVEPGPFLAGDGGEVDQELTRVEDGAVRVEHERVGADDGKRGRDVAATVELRIRDDAPAADAVVAVADPSTDLAESDYPVRSFGRNATIAVAGGGEPATPPFEPEGAPGGEVGVTTAADVNRTVDGGADAGEDGVGDGSAGDGADGDDELPGFGVVGALAAVLVAVAVLARRR